MVSLLHGEITDRIIGAAYEVHRILGYGYMEKVYQRAMVIELESRGVRVESEAPIRVWYKEREVGLFRADLWVEQRVLVEIKVAKSYCSEFEAQLLNELKATQTKVGMLVNFGKDNLEFRRFVY